MIAQHIIELEHIQLEHRHGRYCHLRSFVDQWYCHKHGYISKNGRAAWGKIAFSEMVSEGAVGKTLKEVVHKEHVVPLKVITESIKDLPKEASLAQIESVLDSLVLYATISHHEDELLRKAKLNHVMPKEYYDPSSDLYLDPMARYKKVGIKIVNGI